MRFFAAAIGRRSKEAIRRASTSTKASSSSSGSARLTYPYRSAVAPSKSFAPRMISSARPRPTSGGRRSVPPPGCTPAPTFDLSQHGVLARCEPHAAGEDELAAHATHSAPDLRDADDRGPGETNERVHQDREAGGPGNLEEAEALRRQFEVGNVELRVRALEDDDTQVRAGVDSSEQILEAFEHSGAHDVEGRVVEYNPPVRGCLLDD